MTRPLRQTTFVAKEISLTEALNGLAQICAVKRAALAEAAGRRSAWRRGLHLTSGVLALLSGAGITSVIADLTSSMTVKVLSAVVAFVSGIITLLITAYFDEKETAKIYDGSAKFLALRDQAMLAPNRPDITEKQAFAALEKLRAEHARHSLEFDRFIPNVAARSSFYNVSGKPDIAGTSKLTSKLT